MCVDDDDEIQELETSVRVPPPPVVIVSDGSKKANNSRLEKLDQPSAAMGHPISRQPQVQQQNGGLSDISECEEEVPAESGRTTSPVRSKVSAVAKATSPSRSPSIRSPERGRKAAVAAHDAKLNGVQPAGERIAIPKEAVALCTTASAVFGLQEDALNQQPPLKRRKRTKTNNKSSPSHQEEDEAHSDTDSAAVFGGENADSATKSPLDHLIPTDIRFDPKSLENKPKGLVDALSNFFTPGLKRTSRTAMNSLLKPEIRPSAAAEATPMTTSGGKNSSDAAATELTKKVRLSVDEKEVRESSGSAGSGDFMSGDAAERKRHASAGQQQVKSLYDGLSHLYSDCDSRLRSVPTTNYNEKGRTATGGEVGNALAASAAGCGLENATAASADLLKAAKSPERISSPHRMSDAELKEKEKAAGTTEGMTKTKTEGEKEEKGTSKRKCLHASREFAQERDESEESFCLLFVPVFSFALV